MENLLIVIGARGGSKGVKGKNIRSIAGKPLIAYTIQIAREWGKAKHVVVSTDSLQIAKIARKFGAEVPFMRPSALASDTASKVDALRHALLTCEKIYKERYDILVDLDATAPIRTIQDLNNCLKFFLKYRPKVLFSVVEAHKNPYFNMVEVQKDGRVQLCKKLKTRLFRRQDCPKVYALNASIYFYDRNFLVKSTNQTVFTDNTRMYVMDDLAGIDIDREIDFKYVEFLLKEGMVHL